MYGLYTGVQAAYWCTGCILVYGLYTGVRAVYWCTGCILVYGLYTGVQAKLKTGRLCDTVPACTT